MQKLSGVAVGGPKDHQIIASSGRPILEFAKMMELPRVFTAEETISENIERVKYLWQLTVGEQGFWRYEKLSFEEATARLLEFYQR